MTLKCDVLVIGGGPAGSSAARAAAKKGADTILIEKQKEISQIACAEGVGSYLFPLLPFKIPKNQLIWRIDGISFSNGQTEIIQKGHFYKGWSIDRKNFDTWLLENAKNNGAKILMNSELTDIEYSKDYQVTRAIVKQNDKTISIEPKTMIAADGVESTVAKKLGIIKRTPDAIAHVYSWEMKNVNIKYPHIEQMYFGDFAPRAYAYVFPKSQDTANVGVGSTHGDKNLEEYFNMLTNEIIPTQLKNAVKTVDRSGKAPIKSIIPQWKYGNILFAGDSANQNFKPYIEGTLPSIICGNIAGIAACLKNLELYEESVMIKLGKQFKNSDELLEKLYQIDQIKDVKKDLIFMYLFAFLDTDEIDNLFNKNIEEINEELLRKSRHVNSFITVLYYLIWYLKVLATRRD